jgi:hypothetical protein
MNKTECNFPKDEFQIIMPQGCEKCKKPLDDCRCPEYPAMDGIHWYEGEWLCEACLHEIGCKEFLGDFSKRGARRE